MKNILGPRALPLAAALLGCAVAQYDPTLIPGDPKDGGEVTDAVTKNDGEALAFDIVTEKDSGVTPEPDVVTEPDVVAPEVDAGGPATDAMTPGPDSGGGCPGVTTLCGGSCRDLRTDPANCGACGNACTGGMRCALGTCACGAAQALCGSSCVNTATDAMNCGACGRACAAGQSCVAGACMVVCPAGQSMCAGACTDLNSDATNCGRCGNTCTMGAGCMAGSCVGGTIGGPSFQVNALQTSNCRVIEHGTQTGDDRGPIAVTNGALFYTGDSATARFDLNTLAPTSLGRQYDGIFSNLRSGALYALANGTTLVTGAGGMATTLVELDPMTGAPTTRSVTLGSPIRFGTGRVGIFAGWDRAVILANGRAYDITLPSGAVNDLGAVTFPAVAASCEAWAIWGVAEFFGGALYVDFVQNSTTIARMRLPDGMTAPLSRFTNLSDMCAFTVQPTLRRWYFHHEGVSQFGGSDESAGYCDAQVVADGLACPMGTTACGPFCRNLQNDTTNCGACGTICPAGQVCNAGACGCAAGQSLCGTTCLNTQTDRANCGMCGNACPGAQLCVAGRCLATGRYTAGPAPADVAWVDVCAQGRVLAGIDDSATLITIPFEFPFWTSTIAAGARVNVSTNGFLSLDGTTASNLSGSIPLSGAPNGTLALQWGDLVTGSSGICHGTVGTAPNRRWVVQWSGTTNYSAGGNLNFEAILHEGSGIIDFVYGTMTGAVSRTVGVENPTGTEAVGACGATTCVIPGNTRIRFTPGA